MINSKHGKLRNRTRSLYYLMNYLAEFVELIQPQPFTRCFNKNRDRVFDEKREKKGRKKREGGEKDLKKGERKGFARSCGYIYVLATRHKRCLQRYKSRRGAIYIDREADCVIAIKAIL